MGKVITPIKITNYIDVILQRAGVRAEAPRAITVDALVDTGATELCLRRSVVEQLGLQPVAEIPIRTANGVRTVRRCGPVLLEVMGRDSRMDVIELDDDAENLLGHVPLQILDFVVSPPEHRLMANPAHGGRWMAEVF